VRVSTFYIPFYLSCAIHIVVIMLASSIIQDRPLRRQDNLQIGLIDLPPTDTTAPKEKIAVTSETKKIQPARPAVKYEKPQESPPLASVPITKPDPLEPSIPRAKQDATKTVDAKSLATNARVEAGGRAAGSENLVETGDVGVIADGGSAGGGGGTAAAGLGPGSSATGLPPHQTIFKTNREAKALRTVRAAYPAMALRAGLESDVALRIEVDLEGRVTRAEIVKSGGSGFDEEALKAVKQSRFEPAQRDGQNIPAEFTFVYRFRLQR
jgi:TonB family protein